MDNGVDETIETKLIVNAAGVYLMRSTISFQPESFILQHVKGNICFWTSGRGSCEEHDLSASIKDGKRSVGHTDCSRQLLVGPTAVNVEDKGAVNTTMNGLDQITRVSSHSVKNVPLRQVITSFAGLRAHEMGMTL